MTDKPKAENDNQSSEPVKHSSMTLSPCLHCAIVDIVNVWSEVYEPNGLADRAKVMVQLSKIVAELIEQVPEDERFDALGFFTVSIARRLKLTEAAPGIDATEAPPPASPRTKH